MGKIEIKKFLSKVPEITMFFWIIKILSTTVGETGADYLAETVGLGLVVTSVIMSIGLIIAVIVQLKQSKYVAVSYWVVVIMMSIVGTLITDLLVDELGVSLILLTVLFTIAMVAIFIIWYKKEKTLSIHSINTPKREGYYWVIILIAFALGTGVGDLLSEMVGIGYLNALLLFSAIIAVTALAYYKFDLNETISFWIIFIVTRPVGASLGDLLIQSKSDGGLGFGLTGVNILFFIVIISLVGYLSVSKKDVVQIESE